MTPASTPACGVLMVTGAYFPELSGGGLQCKALIEALRARVQFSVLTTCTDPRLPLFDTVDGVAVRRVFVNVRSRWSKFAAAWSMAAAFLRARRSFDIVHLHGFSQKSVLLLLLAKLTGKRAVLTLHTAGQDEPASVARFGWLAAWAYARMDLFVAISAPMAANLLDAGIAPSRVRRIANGFDPRRFRPAEPGERQRLRRALGLPVEHLLILFVGFFSTDKGPHVLFDAWRQLEPASGPPSSLVYVGATKSQYYEVDESLAATIGKAAGREGLLDQIFFIEASLTIEEYYRAADLFVFPSRREAFGMALVEAMASGLPCIASRIAGVTDEIVRDGETGLLVAPHDVGALAAALSRIAGDPLFAARLGAAARRDVEARFSIEHTARQMLDAYRSLSRSSTPALTAA